jgi:hypothetical protein
MADPKKVARITAALEINLEGLIELPNVVGVATGFRQRNGKATSELAVQTFVERKLPLERIAGGLRVPLTVVGVAGEEVRTDVVEISLPEAQQDTTRFRPVPGGCSIGPESSNSAGTLGGWAADNTDATIVLLSNNHVISNLDAQPVARRIVQPGRLDGGSVAADVIGSLKRDIQLQTIANPPPAGVNPPVTVVDAAIGTITTDRTDNIQQLGLPAIYEVQTPAVNMDVQKRGRTTRLTTNGRITSINGTFNTGYRNGTRLGRIANVFMITSTDSNVFSGPGDSGSLILNQQQGRLNGTVPVLGLLYAGGTLGDGRNTPFTLACDINAVFGALNLTNLCTAAVRALIRSIGRSSGAAAGESLDHWAADKELQLRQLRSRVLRKQRFGKVFDELITTEAAELGRLVLEDEETFGLAVRTLEPLVLQPTNLDLLDAELDPKTVANVKALTKRLARGSKRIAPQLNALGDGLQAVQGKSVRSVLRGEMNLGRRRKR